MTGNVKSVKNFFKIKNMLKNLGSLIKSTSFCQKRVVSLYSKNLSNNLTHFGFETVKENEKVEKVHKVFEDVASSYDLMNDALSLGIHRIWKDILMERLSPTIGTNLLDMAGGTGDIAFRYVKYLENGQTCFKDGRTSHVTISDINLHMLDVGKARADKLGLANLKNTSIAWKQADAESLPFASNTFTAYTIAFGIRNCTHIDRVLSEAHRVLKRGGRFLCLEFSHVNKPQLQKIYDKYSFEIIPPLGQILAGQWDAYKYLVESIRKFPRQEEFHQMIRKAGFKMVTYENLTFGICAIHSGYKL